MRPAARATAATCWRRRRARSSASTSPRTPIAHARARYAAPNLRYLEGSCTALPLPDAGIDLVVSFETIEHLAAQAGMLAEFRRVLAPGGVLVISSPNQPVYSGAEPGGNEFHVRELTRGELGALLDAAFPRQRWYGQRIVAHSALWEERADPAAPRACTLVALAGDEVRDRGRARAADVLRRRLRGGRRGAARAARALAVRRRPRSPFTATTRARCGARRQLAWEELDARKVAEDRLAELITAVNDLASERERSAALAARGAALEDAHRVAESELAAARARLAAVGAELASTTGELAVARADLARLAAAIGSAQAELAAARTTLAVTQDDSRRRPGRGRGHPGRPRPAAGRAGRGRGPPRLSRIVGRLAALAVRAPEATAAGGRMTLRPIDVIVPVHGAAAATRRCLDSVLAAPQRAAFELVVVDDASADPDLALYLRELAAAGRVTLVEQPARAGFAAAVNRGLALHDDRDAVILHSDAVVANDWLDRLAWHAQREPGTGIVVPFTNRGGPAGYPRLDADNALPDAAGLARTDRLLARANPRQSVALPIVSGPCLYLRRECAASVGAFDGAPLGSDCGVEIDFCLRAGSVGFRHFLAGDVYVGHEGHATFGAEAAALAARSDAALASLYPRYAAQRAAQRTLTPGRAFARRADMLRLAEWPQPLVVFIAHGWGGGIRRHMNDLAALARGRCEVLYLEPAADDTVKLHWARPDEEFAAYFTLPGELAGAGRHAAGAGRGAAALPPRPPAAAGDTRSAGGGGAALRLHAARLLPDLPAVPPRHRRRPLLRRARRRRLRRVHRAAAAPVGPRHHVVARGVRAVPGRGRAGDRALRRRRQAPPPVLSRRRWSPSGRTPRPTRRRRRAWRGSSSSAACRRRRGCAWSRPARRTRSCARCR